MGFMKTYIIVDGLDSGKPCSVYAAAQAASAEDADFMVRSSSWHRPVHCRVTKPVLLSQCSVQFEGEM